MTWAYIKYWLKKSWVWLKTHWWAGVLLAGSFILYKFFLYKKNEDGKFSDLFEATVQQGKAEIKVLEDTHKVEVQKIKEAQAEHKEILSVIREDRKKEGKRIKLEEKKRIKEIVAMPEEERVKALADEFGLEVVEAE
jgi:hypothetical protein